MFVSDRLRLGEGIGYDLSVGIAVFSCLVWVMTLIIIGVEYEQYQVNKEYMFLPLLVPLILFSVFLLAVEVIQYAKNWINDFDPYEEHRFYVNYVNNFTNPNFTVTKTTDYAWSSNGRPSHLYIANMLGLEILVEGTVLLLMLEYPWSLGLLFIIPVMLYLRKKKRKEKASETASDYIHDQP